MRIRTCSAVAPALALLFVLVGCGGSGGSDGAATTTGSTTTALKGTIRVAAAASLTESFATLGKSFEAAHPGTKVTFDFGPSSGLSDGLVQGAPGDVFASADEQNMDKLVRAKVVATGTPVAFARNRPEIAVPVGNPGAVEGLADFARDDLLVGLCAADVPCGRIGRVVLEKAGVVPAIDTNEVDVKALLGKLETADLDVGLVYHADVVAAGDRVEGIPIAPDQNVIATYPIAPLAKGANPDVARAFVAYARSSAAQAVLTKAGFLSP